MIKIIRPRLKETYKIKIGFPGKEIQAASGMKYRKPEKLDHFLVCKPERDTNALFVIAQDVMAELAKDERYGANPRRLPISFMFNDVEKNFYDILAYYVKSKCICKGDGETATRYISKENKFKDIDCPGIDCQFLKNKKCKPMGILKCFLRVGGGSLGGAAVFRTTSWNTITYLRSSLAMLLSTSHNRIAGVPLDLVVSPEERNVDGKKRIIYTVNVEFTGAIPDLINATQTYTIDKIVDAQEMLTTIPEDDPADIVDEFYGDLPNEDEDPFADVTDADGQDHPVSDPTELFNDIPGGHK